MGVTIRLTDFHDTTMDRAVVDELAAGMRGELLDAGSPGYDAARTIWNGMVDRHPALIARCRGAADVVRAVRFARRHGVLVSVRGGGHNIAGSAITEHGLVIDLSPMRAVRVDPTRRTARVEPGATLGDFDGEAQAFGLATPLGINSTTGVAGLTVGGGFGWLSRKYGLTIDNLLSADVVTADGTLVTASEGEHPDLFWAIRGGGGNFGVVTSFEFQLHPVGPEVLAGLIVHRFDDAAALLRAYRDVAAAAPDELSAWVVLRKAPPLPFLPPALHGREILVFAALYAGDVGAGEAAMAPLRRIGSPVADVVAPQPYVAFQGAFDPLLAPGARNYWKSHNFSALHDEVIEAVVASIPAVPDPQCEVFLPNLGGAVQRVPTSATAYASRDAAFVMNIHGRWDTPARDEACIRWARGLFDATAPYASGGAYVNFLTEDEGDRVRAAYGPNHDRLRAIKRRYDPTNLFRPSINILP